MKYKISNTEYDFFKCFQHDDAMRISLNILSQKTFGGLSFEEWYQQGFWSENCIPYALFDHQECVANIFANKFYITVQNKKKLYIQLGTVMTASEYRNQGLLRFLMQEVFKDWLNNCDAMYLYANNSVLDFYPKFGFTAENEYQYNTTVSAKKGIIRKLNIESEIDKKILLEKIQFSNPFSLIKMRNNVEYVMFHCIMFQKDNLYYLPEYDAVIVKKSEGKKLYCFDIFCREENNFNDILSIAATETHQKVFLGFTPKKEYHCEALLSQEEDTQLFVLKGKDNIFKNNKLMFPILCHT